MDREVFERLVRVEERLEATRERVDAIDERTSRTELALQEHRDESRDKHDELKDAITALGVKLDERAFRWSALLTRDNAKLLVYAVSALATGTAAGEVAKALFEK